jgi:hypothetical protein
MALGCGAADGAQANLAVKAEGSGKFRLAVRAANLNIVNPERAIVLQPGKPQTVSFPGQVVEAGRPWVAVIIPNGRLDERREIVGGLPPLPAP